MLTELRIRNVAIIESLSLPLAPGFNVLTGETGAGKSIIVGALGLLLGERAHADVIRTGADRASVEGIFDITERPELVTLLDERGIDAEERVAVLKREVSAVGRARAWINGTPVSASLLAEIGRHLVNLHGQHEAQTLLGADVQRALLDGFATTATLVDAVGEAYDEWIGVRRQIADLERRRSEAQRRADYLRHVVKEIGNARLTDPTEDARLEDEANRLEHAEELRSSVARVIAELDGDEEAITAKLGEVSRHLTAIQRIDSSLERLQELFDAAFYNLEALARELAAYERLVDLDPERLETVRARRHAIFEITRKYGPTLAEAIEVERTARQELDLIDTADLDLQTLNTREGAARRQLESLARDLSARRTAAAAQLGDAVGEYLPALGMPDGRFSVRVVPLAEIGATGADAIEFCVALNVGHEPRLLSRVASGGELSRVTLALKTILARVDQVPTLVFDEVDAGIGGRVGLHVGATLRHVAAHHQVFAITHLPQIAARAHHHIVVSKDARGGVTTADVRLVTDGDRVAEIARMLGGDSDSATSQAHARELLDIAASSEPALVASSSGRRSRRR